MPVYSLAAGVLAGIAFALLCNLGSFVALALLGFGGLLLGVSVRRRHIPLLMVVVCLAAGALGLARTELFVAHEAAHSLVPYVGKDRVVEGVVVNDPERRETSLHVYIRVSSVDARAAQGTMLAMLPREARVAYGDQVTVAGDIVLPTSFETPTGRLFDYPGYLRVRGASALMHFAVLKTHEEKTFSLYGMLFTAKHTFEYALRTLLPEPDVSIMEGMLLGERRGIPEDLNNALIIVGLIHIVVLSGYNISIVAEQVLRFFSLFLSRRAALVVGALAVVAFAITVGLGATVVRATLMGLIAIMARVLGRPQVALRALALAAAAMALWNPLVVLFDPSFILSVLATFGLITLSPTVERRITWVPERFGLRSIIASTIAVQLYILPALLYMTGNLSFFALFANALVLPLVPLVMLTGFATGVLGLVHTAVAFPVAVVSHLLMAWVIGVVEVVAHLPFSAVVVATFPAWVAAVAYLPLTAIAIWEYQRNVAQQPTSSDF